MKLLLLLLTTCLWCSEAKAQNSLPPAFEIKTDTSTYDTLSDRHWQILVDLAGSWGIEQVSKPPLSDKFIANNTITNGLDYNIHVFWFRYRIKNLLTTDAKVCLTNTTNADQCDFYILHGLNKWTHYVTGKLYPNDKVNGLKKLNDIPITIKPGEEITIYNRLQNSYYFNKPKYLFVVIGNTARVIQENYIAKNGFSRRDFGILFGGIMIFGCFLNLFFYYIEKKAVYLYFAFFLFYFFDNEEFMWDVIFPNHPAIQYFAGSIDSCFGIFLFVQFSRYFFQTYNKFPIWDKALKLVAIFQMSEALCTFFIEPHLTGKWNGALSSFTNLMFVAGLYMILITYLKFIKSKDKLTITLLIAAIPATIVWVFWFSLSYTYGFLADRFGIKSPDWVNGVNSWFDVVNLICVVWLALSFSWVLLLQFIQLKKENAQQALDKERLAKEKEVERNILIEAQKIELQITVERRTAELKQSVLELKATQNQLIQHEKMASLGELTAGIAHEIQNPLNFVNNFSDVSIELIAEMETELNKGDKEEAIAIAADIKQNLEKINHHGKRADFIVKGMLQHSRASTGERQLTNINILAEEFIKLAYQGLRSKDKNFNVNLVTEFDPEMPQIIVVQQDIGRVLLNLFNNAFYAVSLKAKVAGPDYRPTVTIETFFLPHQGIAGFKVKDNGIGIPHAIKDKIMQPFFTTKPTGEGTGLGLSLTYDMVVKGHGGSIDVNSVEGEGTEFIVRLPLS
jgi:signal transduction histidine kinase